MAKFLSFLFGGPKNFSDVGCMIHKRSELSYQKIKNQLITKD